MVELFNALRVRLAKEPAFALTVVLIVAISLYKVFAQHTPASDLLSEEYFTYVAALASGLATRFLVWARPSVERELANAAAERTRAADPQERA